MENLNVRIVSKSNLIYNINRLKQHNNNKKIFAVIKANAYGVGIENIIPIIDKEVDAYAVANIVEAISVRRLTKKTVLILGYTQIENIDIVIKSNLIISIPSFEYLKKLVCYIDEKQLKKLKFHIQVNTGMNRFGVNLEEWSKCIEYLKENKLRPEGLYTHFSTKGDDKKYIVFQYKNFIKFHSLLKAKCFLHCENTYTALNMKIDNMDYIRSGFGLYGMDKKNGLKPAFQIFSKILQIRTLKAGESLGYDRTYKAESERKIAVVSIGYADGFCRSLSNNFKLFLNGKYVNVIGRVCMDICFIDITDVKAKVLDDVEIVGKHIKLKDYAKVLNTSEYEVLLNFSKIRADDRVI